MSCRLKALAGTAAAAMELSLAATRNISAEVQEHMRNPGGSHSNTADMQVRPAAGSHVIGVVHITPGLLCVCMSCVAWLVCQRIAWTVAVFIRQSADLQLALK
jgi:hypothetical protein